MHRSSDTIATIAAALAKAQVELTNPEKSLVATIRSPFPREADRSFRYAPLSTGLDLVRKSLGRQEIATIQATDIDKEAGLIRLTTVLAHSSGEWISSEWPVCQIADIASAQRVGAALTYARRYALFALVGIAGEDDLDAPDLGGAPSSETEQALSPDHRRKTSNGQTAGGQRTNRTAGTIARASRTSILNEQLSASLREGLIEQLAGIQSADDAAAWAHRNMAAKNTLAAADAKILEERFQARLTAIGDGRASKAALAAAATPRVPHSVVDDSAQLAQPLPTPAKRTKNRLGSGTVRSLGKVVRLRDKDHRKFVLRQPCLVCGRLPSDPHHLTFTQPRALGRRVSDEFMVPVCRLHHRELHRSGDELGWWRRLNVDPVPIALRLWQQSRADDGQAQAAITTEALQAMRAEAPNDKTKPIGGVAPQ